MHRSVARAEPFPTEVSRAVRRRAGSRHDALSEPERDEVVEEMHGLRGPVTGRIHLPTQLEPNVPDHLVSGHEPVTRDLDQPAKHTAVIVMTIEEVGIIRMHPR